MKHDPAGLVLIVAALDYLLIEFEIRDSVNQQTANPVMSVINMYLIARPAQLFSSRQSGRAGADNTD
jgi:hypothetical protein